MLKSYFTIAWRNLWKTKGFSFINIIGLSTGMMCFIVILLYVKNELSFDRYHKNANHIYRVVKDFINNDGQRTPDATTPPALAPALQKDLPEVAFATRVFPPWGRKYLIQNGNKGFYETNVIFIDNNFFNVFDFALKSGNKPNTFNGVKAILLTETSAKKYFGNADPIGKMLKINVNDGANFLVTGVLKDIPQNSHFTFDFLIPFSSVSKNDVNANWARYDFYTYVLLKPNADASIFSKKLQPLFKKYQPDSKNQFYSQQLTDIHLKSKLKWELGTNNDLSYIRILMIISAFVIVIAGINYVNLVTSQSVKRAKEVGVRKVAGASQQLLVMQFLIESICTAFISFFIALLAIAFFLPFINQLLSGNLVLFSKDQLPLWTTLIVTTLFIGLAAGLYPAFYLSSFQPVKVLKGKFISSHSGVYLRKGLVVFQFLISIALIISFFTIYRQVDFVMQKNLGFNKNNVLLLPNLRGGSHPGALVNELKTIPGITSIARADGILGSQNLTNGVALKGKNDHTLLNYMRIDHAFLPTLQIEMKEGRNFFESGADSSNIILNEKAVAELGLKKPYLGQQLEWDEAPGKTSLLTIIGVTKDFHFTSLHEPIKAFGFTSEENNGSNFFLKIYSQNIPKMIAAIQKVWTKHNPDKPFDYTFQDEQIAKLYQADIKFKNLFSSVTLLAVVIACLGLLGLSIFTAESRAKEIGIRKVLGASVSSLFTLLSKDFLWLVLISIVIASPIAWWAMNRWLQGFAYRVDMSWWLFAMAGLAAIFIALITVSFQAIKAAVANPVKGLRAE